MRDDHTRGEHDEQEDGSAHPPSAHVAQGPCSRGCGDKGRQCAQDDRAPTGSECGRWTIISLRHARQGTHRGAVALDAARLVIVMATQPHGNENRGPQGDDGDVQKARHEWERYASLLPHPGNDAPRDIRVAAG